MYYERIDLSEGTDPAKSNNSKECIICCYWYFDHGFNFQNFVCNVCHNLTMLCFNISNVAIITIKRVDYRCVIHDINSFDAINLSENSKVNDRKYA